MARQNDLVRVNIMLSQADLAALDALAEERGVSRSELVRQAIAALLQSKRPSNLNRVAMLPPIRRMTFEEAIEITKRIASQLKGFDGVAEIRRWRGTLRSASSTASLS